MTPRKKRGKYIAMALEIAAREGLPLDAGSWPAVWAMLDSHRKPTMVYAIVSRSTRRVKFGRSECPPQRVAQLRTASPNSLELWAFCAESEDLNERSIHAACEAFRVSGEWFDLRPETLDFVSKIKKRAGTSGAKNGTFQGKTGTFEMGHSRARTLSYGEDVPNVPGTSETWDMGHLTQGHGT